ncbi:MAG: FHA domain-containing protein [candidate division Zixibacteria bacterium]|nr:FHA domain-containing protein [candidate division Zixibacteria bacterium]
MAEIVVRYEDKVIERVITEKRRISIGRTSDNDIVLENRGVSRKHAVIEINPQNSVIIDNESLNGTFVNDRRVEEEILRDNDTIAIGKYTLVFHTETPHETRGADLDGTMTLETRRHREIVASDRKYREVVNRAGGRAVLMGEDGTEPAEITLGAQSVTFGHASFVNVKVKGWFIPDIQAKITPEGGQYILTSVGARGKTKLNGEPVDQATLKNSDLIQIGKSVFRFVAGSGTGA